MIIVDNFHYEHSAFQQRFRELRAVEAFRNPENKLYAVCLKHPYDIIAAVLYIKEHRGSVYLINGETPLEGAKGAALRANANFLIYGVWDAVIDISIQRFDRPGSLLQYSSGTTGEPKLAIRSWGDIDVEIDSYNHRFQADSDEEPIILVPVAHSFGLIAGALTAIARGTAPHIIADKNPKFALHRILSAPRSIVYGVPFLFHILNSLGKDELRFHKLVSSGAPLPEPLFKKLCDVSKELWHQYGSSETGCISLGTGMASPFDVGIPLRHIGLSVSAGAAVGTAETSWDEIIVSIGERDIHTRDVGYLTGSGSLCVLGRADDLINVSGLKVLPSEVENIIGQMPGVREAAVYKTRHKVWGEAAKAIVIASEEVQAEEIKAWCLSRLPSYKVPSVIQMVNEIPKMSSGKLSRKLLHELECQK